MLLSPGFRYASPGVIIVLPFQGKLLSEILRLLYNRQIFTRKSHYIPCRFIIQSFFLRCTGAPPRRTSPLMRRSAIVSPLQGLNRDRTSLTQGLHPGLGYVGLSALPNFNQYLLFAEAPKHPLATRPLSEAPKHRCAEAPPRRSFPFYITTCTRPLLFRNILSLQ